MSTPYETALELIEKACAPEAWGSTVTQGLAMAQVFATLAVADAIKTELNRGLRVYVEDE